LNETSTGSAATRQWGGNAVAPDDLDVRLGMIKALSQDADHWRRSGKWRQIGFLLTWFLLMIAVGVVFVLLFLFYQLQGQLTLALETAHVLDTPYPRSADHDKRMEDVLGAALKLVKDDGVWGSAAKGHLRKTIGSMDAGLRSWLSDVLIKEFSDASFTTRFPDAVVGSARCIIAGPEATALMNDEGRGFAPIDRLPPDEKVPAIKEARPGEIWFPARWEKNKLERAGRYADYVTQASAGSVICMSEDANWLMVWDPNPPTIKVMMRRFVWNRPEKGAAESIALRIREAKTEKSLTGRRDLERPQGISSQDLRSLKWFRSGPYVGFLAQAKPEVSVAIWTTTGLEDPEEMDPKHASGIEPAWIRPICTYQLPDENGINTCDLDQVELEDMGLHRLVIQYQSDQSDQDARCEQSSVKACVSTIKVEYELNGEKCNVAVLAPFSARILRAHIAGQGLYLLTATGQVLRYTVGLSTSKSLLDNRVIDMK
jgi:hypothetical protein